MEKVLFLSPVLHPCKLIVGQEAQENVPDSQNYVNFESTEQKKQVLQIIKLGLDLIRSS